MKRESLKRHVSGFLAIAFLLGVATDISAQSQAKGKSADGNAAAVSVPSSKWDGIVTGTVIDEFGEPVIGATVKAKGTNRATITDIDGNFILKLGTDTKSASTLVVSCVGMVPQSVAIKGAAKLRIVMEPDANVLSEVEVLDDGFNRLPRKDMVGAYTTIKAADILMPAYESIDQMLQGKVAGMIVSNSSNRVGATPSITIRGTSTLLGNTDPLWVVDGVIQTDPLKIDASDALTEEMSTLIGNQISWLNPQDIETITVLKDASATALYGSKASNGVIVVTTKRGEEGRTSVRYSNSFSIRQRPHYGMFNLMNSQERIQFSKDAYDSGAHYSSIPIPQVNSYEGLINMFNQGQVSEDYFARQMERLETTNTDWFDVLCRNSFSQSHNLSISGGNSKATYNGAFGYTSNHGTEKGNDTERFTARLNIGMNLSSRLRINLNMNGSMSNTDGFGSIESPQSYARTAARSIPLYNEDGSLCYYNPNYYTYKYNSTEAGQLLYNYNILNEINNSYSKNRGIVYNVSANVDFKIYDGLSYQFVGSVSSSSNTLEGYMGEKTSYIEQNYRGYPAGSQTADTDYYKAALLPKGGQLNTSNTSTNTYSMQHKLVYSKQFNDNHRLNVMAGFELRSAKTNGVRNTVWGYEPDRGQQLVTPTYPQNIVPIGSSADVQWGVVNELYSNRAWNKTAATNNQVSYYGMVAYSLMNRYVFNANFRNDASNRFGQDTNHQFNPTYSFGAQWRVAQENFVREHIGWLNQLNLRATYGVQGNAVQSISPDLLASFVNNVNDLAYANEYMLSIYSLPNPLLTWEDTHTWNLGLDMQLLSGITVNVEYYGRRSNAIFNQICPEEYGMTAIKMNGGRIYNQGVEATVNFTPFRTNELTWTIGLNASKNWSRSGMQDRSKNLSDQYLTKNDFLNGNSQLPLRKDKPLSAFWSYSFAGLDPVTGYPTFNNIDVEGEGSKEVDPTTFLVYSGQKDPYFTGGINTRIRWKSLTLGANFAAVIGSKKRLPNPYANFTNGNLPSPFVNLNKDLLSRWTKPGDEKHTIIPALFTSVDTRDLTVSLPDGTTTNNIYSMWANSDAMVASGSFLRCSQISLTYQFPTELVKKVGASSFQLNANMNNVFVIADKRWNGFDPELNGTAVQPKIFSFGLSLGF